MSERLEHQGAWLLLGTLGALVAVNMPQLGSDPWPFRAGPVHASGLLAPLVRAADGRWDVGVLRSAAVLGGVLVALAACLAVRTYAWRREAAGALALVVIGLVLVPPVLLQAGLRQSAAPWFYTNDSTYQIELAGDLAARGGNPYGHDYGASGLERFYSLDGSVSEATRAHQVALHHFAYFPGTVETAAAWSLLPRPLDDYRILVLLATLGLLPACLLFRAPLAARLALGAVLAANPLAVRAAWFGTADAPSLLFVTLAFALLTRSRYAAAAASLGAAVLLKQFALVAVPFFALMLLQHGARRRSLRRVGTAFGAVLLAGFLPFLVADPGALWSDTVSYGTGTYRIIGYGLAALLLRAGAIDDRFGPYPFALLALVVWLPVTAWLLLSARRAGRLWASAAGFSVSIFVLLFLSRVFQNSYLVWPLTGIALTALLAAEEGEREPVGD